MGYYRGDASNYYRGDYYRGDPFLGTLLKVGAKVLPKVGKAIGRAVGLVTPTRTNVQQVIRQVAQQAIPSAVAGTVGYTLGQNALPAAPQGSIPGARPGEFGNRTYEQMLRAEGYSQGYLKRRKMNPLNPKALRRALRRTEGFEKFAKRTVNALYRVIDGRKVRTFKKKSR